MTITMTLDEMIDKTRQDAGWIAGGKLVCPLCDGKFAKGCVCMFYREYFGRIINMRLPEKFRTVRLSALQPSKLSRLPLDLQAALYDELRANPDSGWAFFAPAGYSKTTCSYALYRHAILENLKRSYELFPNRNTLIAQNIRVWRVSVPDLLAQMTARFDEKDVGTPPPVITVEKIEQAVRERYCPRVFLEEIDKIKVSEWNINQLFRIFDAVDRHKGQLVLDSNLNKTEFTSIFGEPIARRVKENCIVKEYGF